LLNKLAAKGANVTVVDINQTKAEHTAKEITMMGGNAVAVVADVSDPESIRKSAEFAREHFGDVTILINNAGIVSGKKILENSNEMIKKTFEINSIAMAYTLKEFLPAMLEKKGHIVTISSVSGFIGTPGLIDYSASKFAALGFDESLRQELALQKKHKVVTTCICPYFVNTGMFDGVQTKFPTLLPIIEPEWASERIVNAILNEEKFVVFPWFAGLAFLLKAILPTQLYDSAMDFFGVQSVMRTFKGKL